MTEFFLIAMYKEHGVHPVGIVYIIQRLLAKCLLLFTDTTATVACGNLNLYARLGAGIEVSFHATLIEYGKSRSQPTDAGEGEANRNSP